MQLSERKRRKKKVEKIDDEPFVINPKIRVPAANTMGESFITELTRSKLSGNDRRDDLQAAIAVVALGSDHNNLE